MYKHHRRCHYLAYDTGIYCEDSVYLIILMLHAPVLHVQIDALTDHIEKLMTHLKHEAAAKAKAFEATKRAQRELQDLKGRNAALLKRNAERENLITELKVCHVIALHSVPPSSALLSYVIHADA